MKKIMSILFVFCLILSILVGLPIEAQASSVMELSTGGTASKVTYTQNGNSEEIRVFSSSKNIARHYVIPPEGSIKNYRLVFEISNTSVSKTIRFDINKGSVVQIRMANMSDPLRTSVVVETTTKPNYTLSTSSDGKSVLLMLNGSTTGTPSTTPTPVPSASPKPTPTPTPTPASTPSPTPSTTPAPSVAPSPSPTPNVTIPASSAISGGALNQPVLITKNGPLSWSMVGDTCKIELSGISLTQTTIGSTPRFEVREKEKLIQITIPGKDTRFTDGFISGNSIIYGGLVNYSLKQNSTIIRISYSDTITYTHSTAQGSSVFMINTGKTSIPVNSPVPSPSPIVSPKPTPTPTPTPSATPGPSATPTPKPTTTPSPQPSSSITNIKTGLGDGKVALRLTGSGIVSQYNSNKGSIVTDDPGKGSVTFMIPLNVVNLGNGTLAVNDSLVKSITTFSTLQSSFLKVEKTDPNMKFEIVAGATQDELYVSVVSLTNPVDSSKVVVLDPGHGGSDPGAVISGYHEKKYNLDIALRVEAILKSKGVNVHMTRNTDVYVSLDDRVKFANDKKATVFVSIHNNSMPNGMRGSMVLYHYKSYNGKAYATTMLDNLLKDLGTVNLGLSARQNTVVLRDTKMPAILAEVACMSDPSDLSLLNSDAFIQKAAESLANSIIKILSN